MERKDNILIPSKTKSLIPFLKIFDFSTKAKINAKLFDYQLSSL